MDARHTDEDLLQSLPRAPPNIDLSLLDVQERVHRHGSADNNMLLKEGSPRIPDLILRT